MFPKNWAAFFSEDYKFLRKVKKVEKLMYRFWEKLLTDVQKTNILLDLVFCMCQMIDFKGTNRSSRTVPRQTFLRWTFPQWTCPQWTVPRRHFSDGRFHGEQFSKRQLTERAVRLTDIAPKDSSRNDISSNRHFSKRSFP